jgi:hypothetical protein
MKHPCITHATAIVLALVAASSFATGADIPERGPIPFAAMDSNGDGYVSSEEFRAAHDARFAAREAELKKRIEQYRKMERQFYSDMDANQDGKVTHEEFEAFRAKRMEQRAQERAQRKQEYMEKRREMQQKYEEHSHEHNDDHGKEGSAN